MQLNHLSILNYKNIAQADLTFSPGINCFLGSNGEGKTNVIDSIYFLSFTKSATNSVDSLNIRHGEEMMMLKGEYEIEGVRELISCGLKSGLPPPAFTASVISLPMRLNVLPRFASVAALACLMVFHLLCPDIT